MGWYYTEGASRADVVKERTTSWSGDEVSGSCLAYCCVGNVLWTVWEIHPRKSEPYRYIGCDVMDSAHGSWGYKPMNEQMGPWFYTCPLAYLRMVPKVAHVKWRAKVEVHHVCRAKGGHQEAV